MAGYDTDCYNLRFEAWVRQHVASSNTLALTAPAGNLERRVDEFLGRITIIPLRVVARDISEEGADADFPAPFVDPEPLDAYDVAQRAFDTIAAPCTVVTDFHEAQVGKDRHMMSGTGVIIPPELYETD